MKRRLEAQRFRQPGALRGVPAEGGVAEIAGRTRPEAPPRGKALPHRGGDQILEVVLDDGVKLHVVMPRHVIGLVFSGGARERPGGGTPPEPVLRRGSGQVWLGCGWAAR